MQVLEGLPGLRSSPRGAVVTVGNFDGIHRGHERILRSATEMKASRGASGVTLVTFEPHPLTVLRPALAPPRLTPPSIKQALLAQTGVDTLVVLPPNDEVLHLAAEEFWAILRLLNPAGMVEGRSFSFGKNRGGNIERLKQWTGEAGVELQIATAVNVALLNLEVVEVSSSLVRWLLSNGRVRDAAICLGRPYALEGTVVKGFQRGRTIGVPTANVQCQGQMVPADGVYAGRVKLGGTEYAAAISIGNLPTFDEKVQQIEAHLVGFDGDLYGQTLGLELLDWLREQQKYPGIEALKEQLSRDIRETVSRKDLDASRSVTSVA
jgi:riboflavin kinase/FMN adenylyltransferase